MIEHEAINPNKAMPIDRIILSWMLMSVQGVRRLAESIIFAKPTGSRMWFVHWVLGIAFYIAMGIATWVEEAGRSFDDVKPKSAS